MKTLTLFRHAKSSWRHAVADLFRPLNNRGLSQAMQMAKQFEFTNPDRIYTSPALRAASTALIYKNALSVHDECFFLRSELYECNSLQLMRWTQQLSDKFKDIWFFGHNPTCNDLVALLLGYEVENIVTSGFVRIQLDCQSWSDVKPSCGELVELNNRTYLGE